MPVEFPDIFADLLYESLDRQLSPNFREQLRALMNEIDGEEIETQPQAGPPEDERIRELRRYLEAQERYSSAWGRNPWGTDYSRLANEYNRLMAQQAMQQRDRQAQAAMQFGQAVHQTVLDEFINIPPVQDVARGQPPQHEMTFINGSNSAGWQLIEPTFNHLGETVYRRVGDSIEVIRGEEKLSPEYQKYLDNVDHLEFKPKEREKKCE